MSAAACVHTAGFKRMQPMTSQGAQELLDLGQQYGRLLQESDEWPLLGYPLAATGLLAHIAGCSVSGWPGE
jgi:hypothetical protein